MAKGKPSRAFLEALKQDRKKSGENPTGGFKTPEWFFNNQKRPDTAAPPAPASPASVPTLAPAPAKRTYQVKPLHVAAAAGVVLVLVLISYLAGRAGQAPPKASAPTEQIREMAPQSGVLEPIDRSVSVPPPQPIPAQPQQPQPGAPQAAPQQPTERIVGMNYIVIQGYPKEHEQLAKEAVAALRAGGIECSIEHGLRGYRADWHLVVGYAPFARTSTPECQAYIKKIREIGEKFAGTSKWKRFEPLGYKWQ